MYFLMIITTYRDGSATRKAIYEFDTMDAALARYHKEMGNAMTEPNTEKIRIFVVDENGMCREDWWAQPIVTEEVDE